MPLTNLVHVACLPCWGSDDQYGAPPLIFRALSVATMLRIPATIHEWHGGLPRARHAEFLE